MRLTACFAIQATVNMNFIRYIDMLARFTACFNSQYFPLKTMNWPKLFLKILLLMGCILLYQNTWADKLSVKELAKYKAKYVQSNSNLDLFNFANALYLSGNYKQAYKGYRLVVKRKSKLKYSAMYYMSLCMLKLNKNKPALKILNYLLGKNIKPGLRKTVTSKIKKINSGAINNNEKKVYVKRKALNLFTELSVGYNSNPGLDSENEISFDESDEEASDLAYDGIIGASYWLVDTLKFDMKLAGSLSYNTYVERQDLTNILIGVRLPTAAFAGLYRFRLTPSYSQESDDTGPITSSMGSKFDVTKKFSKGMASLGVIYSLSKPLSDQFSYLDGNLVTGFADLSFNYKKIRLSFYMDYFNNSYIDTTQLESNKGYQLAAKLRYRINDKVSIEGGYRHKNKSYNEADIFFDDGSRTFGLKLMREDVLSQLDFTIKYYINNNFELKLGVSHTENKSTYDSIFTDVGDKNYKLLDGKLTLGIYF